MRCRRCFKHPQIPGTLNSTRASTCRLLPADGAAPRERGDLFSGKGGKGDRPKGGKGGKGAKGASEKEGVNANASHAQEGQAAAATPFGPQQLSAGAVQVRFCRYRFSSTGELDVGAVG
jgi:hypothetical protein